MADHGGPVEGAGPLAQRHPAPRDRARVEPELLVAAAHLDGGVEHPARPEERVEHPGLAQLVAVVGEQRLEVRRPRLRQPDVQHDPRHGPIVSPARRGTRAVASAHVSTAPPRVFAARLVGLPIFDPQGDQVAKVRDLVVGLMSGRTETARPRVLGMVAEVFGRRRIFVPMTRVTHIDSGQVYTTGVLNLRRFEQRPTETLVMGQMLDRAVTIRSSGVQGTVFDVAMEQARNRDWVLSRVAVQVARQGAAPPRPVARRGVGGRGGSHPARGHPGRHPADRRAQRDAPRRRRQRAPRPPVRAPRPGGRGDGRRAAGRRAGGAARGGPGRDPRAPGLGAGRRHPRGDVARRRRRPDRRPPAGHGRLAAGPDGPRGPRGRPPPAWSTARRPPAA